ncbi:unnamed protein product [Prorocentrum cordatum]|uniref:Reverse transcriptase Ty1/copia-type domain-containing protein n=1 Tax=Prorocentrum cordatum TaxID=2364126 RepID=A0ABN9UY36_9DINO|nr:unnamed protein product [Polarella glacialis]
MAHDGGGYASEPGLPLDSFTKSVPPGWRAGMPKYPIRRYTQLLRLWWRQTDVGESACGPAMAGRLRGAAFQIANSIRANRLDLSTGLMREMIGDELLAQPSHEAWQNAAGESFPAEPAGATVLLNALQKEFGMQEQEMNIQSLDAFFMHHRGSLSLSDYLTMWRMTYDEANQNSGLEINDVGRSYLLLRTSGLSDRLKDDIKLKLDGNLSRFEDLMNLLQRMAHAETHTGSSIPEMVKQHWQNTDWNDDSWYSDEWYDDYDNFYEGDWWNAGDGWSQDDWSQHIPAAEGIETAPTTSAASESEDYYGKGKKGKKGTAEFPELQLPQTPETSQLSVSTHSFEFVGTLPELVPRSPDTDTSEIKSSSMFDMRTTNEIPATIDEDKRFHPPADQEESVNGGTPMDDGIGSAKMKRTIFMTTDGESYGQMHLVRGREMAGIIVDPGAAAGLMGTDTMKDYVRTYLKDAGLEYTLAPSNSTFSGIDGNTDPGLAVVTMPLGVPGVQDITFKADLMGGSGSKCPGLLPLPSLLEYNAALFCDILDHRDGVLVLKIKITHKVVKAYFIRVYFTDSGHYLLPIGQFGQQNLEEDKLKAAVKRYCSSIFKSVDEDAPQIQLQASRTGSSTSPDHKTSPTTVPEISWTPTCDWPSFSKLHKHYNLDLFKAWNQTRGHRYADTGDCWPRHLQEASKRLENEYRALPEEFYTFTDCVVITPDNEAFPKQEMQLLRHQQALLQQLLHQWSPLLEWQLQNSKQLQLTNHLHLRRHQSDYLGAGSFGKQWTLRMVFELMSLVEQLVPNTPLIFGKFFNESEGQYMIVPPDLYENEPRLYTVAKKVALDTFLENDIGGIQELPVSINITLASHGPWQDSSYVLFYFFQSKDESNASFEHDPDLGDYLSSLPQQPTPPCLMRAQCQYKLSQDLQLHRRLQHRLQRHGVSQQLRVRGTLRFQYHLLRLHHLGSRDHLSRHMVRLRLHRHHRHHQRRPFLKYQRPCQNLQCLRVQYQLHHRWTASSPTSSSTLGMLMSLAALTGHDHESYVFQMRDLFHYYHQVHSIDRELCQHLYYHQQHQRHLHQQQILLRRLSIQLKILIRQLSIQLKILIRQLSIQLKILIRQTVEYPVEDSDSTKKDHYTANNFVSPFPTWWTASALHARQDPGHTDDYTVDYIYFCIRHGWKNVDIYPGTKTKHFLLCLDLFDDECFSVSSDEILTPDDVIRHWPAVEAADRKEVSSFVQHGIFKLAPSSASDNTVDGTWVRKWADRSKGLVKSRCCGRGFLDRQKNSIDRHSSTASRLSHRMAVSLGVQHDLVIESLDISTAFLQGLKFSEVVKRAAELGHEIRQIRQVWFRPPPNVWRHLREIESSGIYKFLDNVYAKLSARFGKVKRCTLPLIYVGVRHQLLAPGHVLLDQEHYLMKLKPAKVTDPRHLKQDTLALDKEEHQGFRSLLCSLLWVCLTRVDLCHGVVALQAEMIKPTIAHLKQCNQLLARAIKTKTMNGLHYHKLHMPLRLVSITDAGHASKRSGYPYEGKMVLLMGEPKTDYDAQEWWPLGVFPQLLEMCTTGKWKLIPQEGKYIRVKASVIKPDYTEQDLRDGKDCHYDEWPDYDDDDYTAYDEYQNHYGYKTIMMNDSDLSTVWNYFGDYIYG